MSVIVIAPKIQYQKKTNKIRLWYRTKDNFQLSKKDLDFNYYCYVDTRFCEELDLSKFEVDSSVVYKRLTDDREMYKYLSLKTMSNLQYYNHN